MPTPDDVLCRRWGHSFEEDHGDVLVYRPADFAFPRARGRDGIEFRPDGAYVDWAVGAADAPQARVGSWQAGADGRLAVTTASGAHRVVEVLVAEPDRLELQARDVP